MDRQKILQLLNRVKWFGLRKGYWIIKRRIHRLKETLIDVSILFPDYQQTLIKRPLSRTLIEQYNGDNGHNVNFTQYFLGFGLIHYSFIRNLKPKHVLCIGSRKGYIPAILALACKDNGFGHVDFVDAGYDRKESTRHWSGIGFWGQEDPIKHFAKIGVTPYITTHVMTTSEYARMYPHKKYQYIYIDGDHSYEGVKRDHSLFWPKLEKGYFMSFHDVVAHGYLDRGLFGVWRFWKEIARKNSIVFPFPKESGLGLLQKR